MTEHAYCAGGERVGCFNSQSSCKYSLLLSVQICPFIRYHGSVQWEEEANEIKHDIWEITTYCITYSNIVHTVVLCTM